MIPRRPPQGTFNAEGEEFFDGTTCGALGSLCGDRVGSSRYRKVPMLVAVLVVVLNAGPATRYQEVARLAEAAKTDEACALSATRATVVKRLAAVVKEDVKWLAKAEADAAFDGVRDTLAYQRLRGLSPHRDADVPEFLVRLSFVSEARDAFGPKTSLRLHADGTADYQRLVSSQCDVIQHPQQGTWTREGRTVTVTLLKPVENVTTFKARFGADGRLILDASDDPQWVLSTDRHECEPR